MVEKIKRRDLVEQISSNNTQVDLAKIDWSKGCKKDPSTAIILDESYPYRTGLVIPWNGIFRATRSPQGVLLCILDTGNQRLVCHPEQVFLPLRLGDSSYLQLPTHKGLDADNFLDKNAQNN